MTDKPWTYDPAPDMTKHILFADLGTRPHLQCQKVVRLEIAQDLERELRYCRKLLLQMAVESRRCNPIPVALLNRVKEAEAYLKATEGEG